MDNFLKYFPNDKKWTVLQTVSHSIKEISAIFDNGLQVV